MRKDLTTLKQIVKKIIKEESLIDYSDKWYQNLIGVENLNKYPEDFINWLNEEDSWAETITYKNRIKKLIDLFDMWVNERY